MSDFKSKLPDFQEVVSISGKLFKDLKRSVGEIIQEYKKKREISPNAASNSTQTPEEKKTSESPSDTQDKP